MKWDIVLYEGVKKEKNLSLFLNTSAQKAIMKGKKSARPGSGAISPSRLLKRTAKQLCLGVWVMKKKRLKELH